MRDNTQVRAQDNLPRHTFGAILAFGIITFVLAGLGCLAHSDSESRWWITGLFVFPCVLQLSGLCALRNETTHAFWWFNWLATFLCQGSYCLLWALYSTSLKTSQGWSYFALGWTLLMLLFVAVMTFAIMRAPARETLAAGAPGEKDKDAASNGGQGVGRGESRFRRGAVSCFQNLTIGVGDHPFWAITFFMSLFLGVAYLFSFALAFHDQNTLQASGEMPALHMVNLKSVDDGAEPEAASGPGKEGANKNTNSSPEPKGTTPTPTPGGNPPSRSGEQEEFCFYFEVAEAHIRREDNNECGETPPKRAEPGVFRAGLFNNCSLQALAKKLKKLTDERMRVKVTLLGHTDNEPIKTENQPSTPYLSNYELSEARAQNVRYELLRHLRDAQAGNIENLEWIIYSASAEPLRQINHGVIDMTRFTDPELKSRNIDRSSKDVVSLIERNFSPEEIDFKLDKKEKRVVIATIQATPESPGIHQGQLTHLEAGQNETLGKLTDLQKAQNKYIEQSKSKRLKLMDYIYFSIYTITTTGYGDIIPTTAYAKFVTSVANIFEVIFLVVFFNALLSLKGASDDNPTGRPITRRAPEEEASDRSDHGKLSSITPKQQKAS